jgi:hypothetical protein
MATPSTPPPTEWRRVAGGVVLLTAVMAAMLTAFALPPLHAGPNQIPIAVVGSAAATHRAAHPAGAGTPRRVPAHPRRRPPAGP